MRVSLSWLGELVEIRDPEALPAALTFAGLEVERVERIGSGLEHILVARILSSQPHSKADRLSVIEVDAGDRRLQIVCGAKNYRVGDRVPLAPPGTVLPGGQRIEEAELRGVRSFGMLCSAAELGIPLGPGQSEGLWLLDQGEPGERLVDVLPLVDTAFEINVTPNRADCLSHLGIAREVAALTGGALHPIPAAAPGATARVGGLAAPRIEDPERCGRFLGQPVVAGSLHTPAPFAMRYRLQTCGVRPIGLAVDVTNYVMLELGQPLHAYDLDKLRQGLVVRRGRPGERLFTLDGVERAIAADDLLICDGPVPVGLAGVMGGRETEVSATTQRLYLEAAYFEPGGIRRTAKRHGLPSEASHRFERGVDPELQARALSRAVGLLARTVPELTAGEVQSAQGKVPAARRVRMRLARAGELLGRPVAEAELIGRLRSVGVIAAEVGSKEALFDVPSHRQDLTEMVDLISEVGRLGGYDAIPAAPPRRGFEAPREGPADRLAAELREALRGAGFSETVNYSFLPRSAAESFSETGPVALVNPLGEERGVMRTSLLPSLCGNVRFNLAHLTRDAGVAPSLRLYEIGRTYSWPQADESPEGPALESHRLGIVWHGPRFPLAWASPRDPADASDLRGLLEMLAQRIRKTVEIRPWAEEAPGLSALLHPRSATELWSGTRRIGLAGEIHPQIAKQHDLPRHLLLAELDLEALRAAADEPRRIAVPRFPAVLRDVAFIVGRDLPQDALREGLRTAAGELLESVVLFDVYEGAPLAAGEKSLAYSLRFRAADRTLTDAEVAKLHAAMVAAVAARFQARLRSANSTPPSSDTTPESV